MITAVAAPEIGNVCQCRHGGSECGCPNAEWFCERCNIYLADECGCSHAHPLELKTIGHLVFRKLGA